MNFLEVVKEVSAQGVRREASRALVLGLAGDAEEVEGARSVVLGSLAGEERRAAESFLCCATPPYDEETERRLRYADVLVSLPGGPGPADLRPADTLRIARREDLIAAVLAHRPDLAVTLARRFPGFREAAAEKVIRDVSRVNAEFATISGASAAIPILAPLFPAVAGADVLVLTKNQVLMMFRLAAIYGEGLDVKARLREVLPVVAGALGWRTLARQLAGVLPGALGLPVKAGIAYTGTYAAGRAAQLVFDEGRRPTREEMRRIYDDGAQLARELLDRLVARRERPDTSPPAALPAGPEATPGEGSPTLNAGGGGIAEGEAAVCDVEAGSGGGTATAPDPQRVPECPHAEEVV